MFASHYAALVGAYATALVAWWALSFALPLWPASREAHFGRPLREFGLALLGGVGVVLVGQLWVHGVRLPEAGVAGPLAAALNQVVIFSPILIVPILRRHSLDSIWCGGRLVPWRLLAGLILAALAIVSYSLLRSGAASGWTILKRMVAYDHLDELVQVLLEDLVVALLFVRLAARLGNWRSALVVGCLFAAGHVPTLVSSGATLAEISKLLLDFGLAAGVLLTLSRSRDIVWFWPIHFVLDMTQFDRLVLAR